MRPTESTATTHPEPTTKDVSELTVGDVLTLRDGTPTSTVRTDAVKKVEGGRTIYRAKVRIDRDTPTNPKGWIVRYAWPDHCRVYVAPQPNVTPTETLWRVVEHGGGEYGRVWESWCGGWTIEAIKEHVPPVSGSDRNDRYRVDHYQLTGPNGCEHTFRRLSEAKAAPATMSL
jgi:hypothetical protein